MKNRKSVYFHKPFREKATFNDDTWESTDAQSSESPLAQWPIWPKFV